MRSPHVRDSGCRCAACSGACHFADWSWSRRSYPRNSRPGRLFVAARIAACEKTITLLETIDTAGIDLTELQKKINAAFATMRNNDGLPSAPRSAVDASAGKLSVWATESQLAVVHNLVQRARDSQRVAGPVASDKAAERSSDSTDPNPSELPNPKRRRKANETTSKHDEVAGNTQPNRIGHGSEALPPPHGPVQIERLEGTDTLLLRERGGGQRGEARLLAPKGLVRIVPLEGTDILLLRGR